MHNSLRQLFVGLLPIRCLWRLILPRRTDGHLTQRGMIPSVSLLIYFFGNGMDRYVGAMQRADSPLEVNVRGFSAGSYSGLAFLHILWSIPRVTTKGCLGATARPPSLLSMSRAKREDRLHLIHFESDSLCSWKPGPQLLHLLHLCHQ